MNLFFYFILQSCTVVVVSEMELWYDIKSTAQIRNLVCKVTFEFFFILNNYKIMGLSWNEQGTFCELLLCNYKRKFRLPIVICCNGWPVLLVQCMMLILVAIICAILVYLETVHLFLFPWRCCTSPRIWRLSWLQNTILLIIINYKIIIKQLYLETTNQPTNKQTWNKFDVKYLDGMYMLLCCELCCICWVL